MRKSLLLFFSFVATYSAKAQTFVLLDRHWNKPARLTDSVTREDLSNGWYPVFKNDVDSFTMLIDKFKNLKDDGLSRKFYYSGDFQTPHIEFQIENIKRTYGDGYEINITSKGPFGSVTLKLSDPRLLLPDNQKIVRTFLAYLKRTQKELLIYK